MRPSSERSNRTRAEIDYVSVKISSICSQLNVLAFDATVDRIATRLPTRRCATARRLQAYLPDSYTAVVELCD